VQKERCGGSSYVIAAGFLLSTIPRPTANPPNYSPLYTHSYFPVNREEKANLQLWGLLNDTTLPQGVKKSGLAARERQKKFPVGTRSAVHL
jgi:hypothetical protein